MCLCGLYERMVYEGWCTINCTYLGVSITKPLSHRRVKCIPNVPQRLCEGGWTCDTSLWRTNVQGTCDFKIPSGTI